MNRLFRGMMHPNCCDCDACLGHTPLSGPTQPAGILASWRLPDAAQLAYTHAALDALLSRTSNRRRELIGCSYNQRTGVTCWTVMQDGQPLPC